MALIGAEQMLLSDRWAAEYMCAVTVPSAASPMSLSRSSSMTSPGPMILDAALVEAALGILLHEIAARPPGTNTNIASGPASFIRCRNGAKSGLIKGTLTSSTISPPAAVNRALKNCSASFPGA